MKKTITFLFLLFTFIGSQAANVAYFMDLCQFRDGNGKPYVECYLAIDGTSVAYQYKTNSKSFQASVHIEMEIFKLEGADSSLVFFDKYNLLSGEIADTSLQNRKQAFVDLKRVPLEVARYVVVFKLSDNNAPGKKEVMSMRDFETQALATGAFAVSDLEYIASITPSKTKNVFNKNGYEIIPFATNDGFVDQDKLQFYMELYGSDQVFDAPYFVKAVIQKNGKDLFQYNFMQKKTPQPIDVVAGSITIADLPSGIYKLNIKIFNPQNKNAHEFTKSIYVANSRVAQVYEAAEVSLATSSLFGAYTEEKLNYYIKTLIHISKEEEIQAAKRLQTKAEKQNYLYRFWLTHSSPEKPVERLWQGHLWALDYANEQFETSFGEGWNSDRGRVLFQYGIPSDVERYPHGSTNIPYEIWKYDQLQKQSQVMFVFADINQATSEYRLIHSTKRGEIQDVSWQSKIYPSQQIPSDYNNRDGRSDYEGNRTIINTGGR